MTMLTLGALPSVSAQPLPPLDEFQIRVFTAADGLVGADVRGLLQGRDGVIYVSNPRGLSRFDGHSFRRVPLPGFRTGNLSAIMLDRRGRVWARTDASEIGYLEDGAFRVLPPAPAPFSTWSETTDGIIWLGGTEGLIRLDPDASSPYTRFGEAHGLPSLRVTGVFDLSTGERVALATNGLSRVVTDSRKPGGLRFEPYREAFNGATELAEEVRVDARGLWFTANDVRTNETHLVNFDAGHFRRFGRNSDRPGLNIDSLGWDSASTAVASRALGMLMAVRGREALRELDGLAPAQAFRGRDGQQWYAFSDGNDNRPQLTRRRGRDLELIALQSRLTFLRLRHVIDDHEGSLWIGTDRGLLQLVPRTLFSLTVADGLASDFTSPILQTRDGALWIGTFGGGLQKFEGGRLTRTFTTADGLHFNQVRALHEGRDGRLWVGTSLGYVVIHAGRVVRSVPAEGEVRSFADGDDGTMWVGTERVLLRDHGNRVSPVDSAFWRDRGIWALHRARDGAIWVGSERGLFRIRGDSVRSFGDTDGLRSTFVVSIAEEADGTLWFGTYDHGLHRYRGERFVAVTTDHGLHNNGVWRMLPDGFGGVWMSSDLGIFRVRASALHDVADAIERGASSIPRLTPIVFTEAEGMPNRESNRGSPGGWHLADGRLVFNNIAGVVVIDPRRVAQSPPAPRTLIEGISADGVAVSTSAPRVSASVRQLAFEFAALSFLAPEQNHFRYRLDGYDQDWVDNGTVRRATYTNLRPGHFTFRVQGATGIGDWSGAEASVSLHVEPLVWQTTWFRLTALVIVVALGAAVYRYRVEQLLEMERMRLRIASDLHDDVGSNLSSIALLSDMLKDASRLDVREQRQMQRINRAAEETVRGLRNIIWLVDPKHGALSDLVLRMRSVAGDMLGTVTWTFTGDEVTSQPLGMNTMRNTLLIYKEALHNVMKHAGARRVQIHVGTERGRLLFRIDDDGVGFDPAVEHAGHGVASMRRRAAQVGGTLVIESAPGRGTRLSFSTRLP